MDSMGYGLIVLSVTSIIQTGYIVYLNIKLGEYHTHQQLDAMAIRQKQEQTDRLMLAGFSELEKSIAVISPLRLSGMAMHEPNDPLAGTPTRRAQPIRTARPVADYEVSEDEVFVDALSDEVNGTPINDSSDPGKFPPPPKPMEIRLGSVNTDNPGVHRPL